MRTYFVGLIFLVCSTVFGMESNLKLVNFTFLNKEKVFSTFELQSPSVKAGNILIIDDDGLATLALILKMWEAGFADRAILWRLMDLSLAQLVIRSDKKEKLNKKISILTKKTEEEIARLAAEFDKNQGLVDMCYVDMSHKEEEREKQLIGFARKAEGDIASLRAKLEKTKILVEKISHIMNQPADEKLSLLKDFVFARRERYYYSTYNPDRDYSKWRWLYLSQLGLVAKDKNSDAKLLEISLPGPIQIGENIGCPNVVSTKINIQDLDMKSIHDITWPLVNRFSEEIDQNSLEYKLISYSLKSIEKAFPAFKRLHQRASGMKRGLLSTEEVGAVSLEDFFKREEYKKIEIKDGDLNNVFSLNFAYAFAWGDFNPWSDTNNRHYWLIEVKRDPSSNDQEFIAQVTMTLSQGTKMNSDFFVPLIPNLELTPKEILDQMFLK